MSTLNYLEDFAELAKRLNFTETARRLNMSQPTLSKHIKQLEDDLKLELFDRGPGSLSLTKAGAVLLPFAYQVLDAQEDFLAKTAELRKTPPPRLTLSGITDEGPSTEILGFIVSILSNRYGSNFLEIKSRFNRDLQEMLGENEVDVVLDPVPRDELADSNLIGCLHIADLKLIAIVSRHSPLAAQDTITLEELSNEKIIEFKGIYLSRSWDYIAQLFADKGINIRTKSAHYASLAEMFAACTNLGSSVLIVGCNFAQRIPQGISAFCKPLRIEDTEARIPLKLLFRKDNENPILLNLIDAITSMPEPPLSFNE